MGAGRTPFRRPIRVFRMPMDTVCLPPIRNGEAADHAGETMTERELAPFSIPCWLTYAHLAHTFGAAL